ncbi:MAG: hypothetical protein P4L99_23725 [Chthoniobacter sp.]|nr:hypothetical protein [Chthoniobacter sp.]
MPAKKPAALNVSKLDAARRQIETAISLWFDNGDPVAIHTLTAAGHRICHDIAKRRGGKSPILFNAEFIEPEGLAEYKKLVCEAENFFKHAEKDPIPSVQYRFEPYLTEVYLIDAIHLFFGIDRHMTDLMLAFRVRFSFSNPLGFADLPPFCDEPLAIKLRVVPRRKFLEIFINQLRKRSGT